MLTSAEFEKGQAPGRLDAFLRFDPRVEELYEAEWGADRLRFLRQSIIVGLVLYNVYNITDLYLIPDIATLAVVLRIGVVTPISLLLFWAIGRVGPSAREWLMTAGIVNAFMLPVLLFWLSGAPLAAYTFNELPLTLVFGNMLLALRFRHALSFTAIAFVAASLAVALKPGFNADLQAAFAVQIATGCALSLYANWRTERARRRSYLTELKARLKSGEADESRRRFEDLSLTDALTGLPNRRALDLLLDACCAGDTPFAVLMVDIDHFKLFNDRLGHPAGDDCLRAIAGAMRRLVETPGVSVARFGGEEFTIVVQSGSDTEVARIAARVVEAIAALGIEHPSRCDGAGIVTASVGYATVQSGDQASRQVVLAAADDALYLAKRRGRNCWVAAREVEDAGIMVG